MTEAELQALLIEWRQRLHLDHWQVWGRVVHPSKLSIPDREAEIERDAEPMMARVDWADEKELPPMLPGAVPRDWETTTVHELIHLYELDVWLTLASLKPHVPAAVWDATLERYVLAVERMICQVSRVMVELKRAADGLSPEDLKAVRDGKEAIRRGEYTVLKTRKGVKRMPHQKGMAAYGGTKKRYQKAARAEKRGKMPKGMHMMGGGHMMEDADMPMMATRGRGSPPKKRSSPKRSTTTKKRK